MHDAITIERTGTPAVAVMTDRFTRTAELMAETCGLPNYPFAIITHPISSNDDAQLKAKADDAVVRCVELLRSAVRRR
ncbi:MAG TPA: hypothetical protein VKA21_16060 [Candidatus Binatia bacterium]|nr:hypothetical protein [Candidatus Binatia bacterium]